MTKVPQEVFGKKSGKEDFCAEKKERSNDNRKDI